MAQLIASAPTKERLEKMINAFYYSENWFINSNDKAENSKTGKILGNIVHKKNRYRFEL